MLGVADWVLAAIRFLSVVVETECTRGDVETCGNLREEAAAKEGFPRTTDTDEEDDEFGGGLGEEIGDCIGIRSKLLRWDFRVLFLSTLIRGKPTDAIVFNLAVPEEKSLNLWIKVGGGDLGKRKQHD